MPTSRAQGRAVVCTPTRGIALDRATAIRTAAVLTALADPERLRVFSLLALAGAGEVCACRLAEALPRLGPELLDAHLEQLLGAGLVARHGRDGWAYYRLTSDGRARAAALLGSAPSPALVP
ncbi:helix-turn-helix transcriptional regulator [Streptomyces sp. NPDC086554]|uniref:ArsR/SmtB family transcription factor n=1 Tax=Streptomyces sp. NPDC086554 TaxID=3154864 RepID=UPI00344619AD